jgi:hypothetical protein
MTEERKGQERKGQVKKNKTENHNSKKNIYIQITCTRYTGKVTMTI